MRFLFDEMLKRLASWCRILGLDSEFLSGKSDSQLLSYAEKNGMVFVTRDLPLSLRCEKRGVKFLLIKSDKIEEQLARMIREYGAEMTFPAKTRCASCNGELEKAAKDDVKGGLPANVVEHNDEFWRCTKCGRVFWEGGHWKNIMRIYERAKELAAS
jgi:uncharacterized protein with PIN domain